MTTCLTRLISQTACSTKQGAKTVLYGCSIEPELLKRPEIMEDMKRYDAIVARKPDLCSTAGSRELTKISIYIRTRLFYWKQKAGSPAGGLGSEKMLGLEH